jgi:hypothetical protein
MNAPLNAAEKGFSGPIFEERLFPKWDVYADN